MGIDADVSAGVFGEDGSGDVGFGPAVGPTETVQASLLMQFSDSADADALFCTSGGGG